MPENDVSEDTYVSEIEKMLTVEGTTTHGTKVISKKLNCYSVFSLSNKKILLRERKRHTARHVTSPWAGGGTYLGGGYPPWPGGWYLPTSAGGGYPPWPGRYEPLGGTYLGWEVPTCLGRGVPTYLGQGATHLGQRGTYLGWGYPPWLGCTPGYPPPQCGRTHTCENITFPHSVANAGGNKQGSLMTESCENDSLYDIIT